MSGRQRSHRPVRIWRVACLAFALALVLGQVSRAADEGALLILPKLSDTEREVRLAVLFENNGSEIRVELDDYGLATYIGWLTGEGKPPVRGIEDFDYDGVLAFVTAFLVRNAAVTGVADVSALGSPAWAPYSEYFNVGENVMWPPEVVVHFQFMQKYGRADVIEPFMLAIAVDAETRKVIALSGHRYPLPLPAREPKFTATQALAGLDGRTITVDSYGEPPRITVPGDAVIAATESVEASQLVVRPMERENRLELRMGWQLFVDIESKPFELFVDALTGEFLEGHLVTDFVVD